MSTKPLHVEPKLESKRWSVVLIADRLGRHGNDRLWPLVDPGAGLTGTIASASDCLAHSEETVAWTAIMILKGWTANNYSWK